MDAVDADVCCVAEGLHFNNRLAAPNVWEIDVNKDVIDIATDIFERGEPFASASKDGEPYESIETGVGSFFLQRINWQSDACWISVDDKESYEAFHSIFTQLKLPERLAPLFPHSDGIQLYSAFYVVRSQCSAHNFHVDYKPEVGVDAMTLITPLQDYEETETFQLSYIGHEDGMYASEFQPLNAVSIYLHSFRRSLLADSEKMGYSMKVTRVAYFVATSTRKARRSYSAPNLCTALNLGLERMVHHMRISASHSVRLILALGRK